MCFICGPSVNVKLTVSYIALASPVPIAAPEAAALANTELVAVRLPGFDYE